MASPIASTSSAPMASSTPAECACAPRQRATSPPTPDASYASAENDRYYGQKEMALLCEHVINSLFDIAPSFPGLPPTPPHSPSGKEPPNLVEFIAYALYRTRLPDAVVHHALFLLSRLKARYPSARGTASSPHRLFLSSLMLSSKINMDDTYSNRSWTIVGGNFFALKEVNQMERELFAFLGWNVVVKADDLATFVHRICSDFAAHKSSGGRKRSTLSQLLAPMPSTPPLSPPPERERSKRRRGCSSGARDAAAEAAAIALLRPGSSPAFSGDHRPAHRTACASIESSAESSAVSSAFPSPKSVSPRTPASPHTSTASAWSKLLPSAFGGPLVYRSGPVALQSTPAR